MDTIPMLQEDYERGGKEEDEHIENEFAYRNNVLNATKEIRLGFLKKVYGILSVQLLMTTIISAIFMYTPPVKEFVHKNDWMVFGAFILSIILIFALHLKRKETPINMILLAGFTVVESYMVGLIVTFYEKSVVVQALFLTLAVVGGLTLFTFQTKRDFSPMYSIMFAGLLVLFVGGLLAAVFQSPIVDLMVSVAGAFLFSLFIVIDTQLMMKHISPEEYILATINLYLDIINLFLYILRILQAARQ